MQIPPSQKQKKQPERQKAHSWMRIYANRRIPDYRNAKRSFEVKCRYVDVAQSRVHPVSSDSVKDGTYTLIIDNIEYTLDGNNTTAVVDALKIHEAFYEKEFKEGETKTIKTEEDLNKKWMYLRGISTRYNRGKSNTDYIQYVKATTAKGIAKWIATALTRSWSNLNLNNMLLDVPGIPTRTTIKLRSYTKDVSPHGEFDVNYRSSFSYFENYEARDSARIARNSWIKKKTEEIRKEIQKELGPKMKAKKMIDGYKKRVA